MGGLGEQTVVAQRSDHFSLTDKWLVFLNSSRYMMKYNVRGEFCAVDLLIDELVRQNGINLCAAIVCVKAAASAVTGLEKLEAGVRMLGKNLSLKSSDELIQVPLVPLPVPVSSLSTHNTSSSRDAPSSSSCHKHAHPTADSTARLPDLYGKKLEKESLEKLLDVSHVHLSLGHYRNQLLHVFLLDSLLALSVEEEIECGEKGSRCEHTHTHTHTPESVCHML